MTPKSVETIETLKARLTEVGFPITIILTIISIILSLIQICQKRREYIGRGGIGTIQQLRLVRALRRENIPDPWQAVDKIMAALEASSDEEWNNLCVAAGEFGEEE